MFHVLQQSIHLSASQEAGLPRERIAWLEESCVTSGMATSRVCERVLTNWSGQTTPQVRTADNTNAMAQ